ncbi:hypothetical protein K439DRAFT_1619142 [Ramaria rubella]|nr:hypothetical protein K439DRAFT_1619142 [Ramaria rubella]
MALKHVALELILQGLASSYADFIHDIASKKIPKPNSPLYNHVVGRWPPLPQLATLLAMVGHPEFFEPESLDGVAFSCSEHLLILREKAIEDVKNMLAFSPELCNSFYGFQKELGCIPLKNIKNHTIGYLLPELFTPEAEDEGEEFEDEASSEASSISVDDTGGTEEFYV